MTDAHKTRTLWLMGVLHAFTHLYQVALLPLYLPIQEGFHLANLGQSTFLVTAMMLGYFLPSYPMGMLADRFSRKSVLGVGLLVNALGFVGLAWAPGYPMAVASVILSGVGGSCFHPAATAMVARLYPVGTGRALGMIGIGASAGFFLGPLYSGWRAATTNNWRAPVLELGVVGVVVALLFLWLADEERTPAQPRRPRSTSHHALFPAPVLWVFFIAAAFAFSLRDFTGSSMGSLGSLFLQHAHGFSVKETGAALSVIFIASTVSNPLFGHLSDRGRLRWTCLVLAIAAGLVVAFPHMPRGWLAPTLVAYGFFFMASYPMVEAALMEAVPDDVRARVFGFWITIGGLVGNTAHWLAGRGVEALGSRAGTPEGYFGIYAGLGLVLCLSIVGLPCLRAIHQREKAAAAALEPSVVSAAADAVN